MPRVNSRARGSNQPTRLQGAWKDGTQTSRVVTEKVLPIPLMKETA